MRFTFTPNTVNQNAALIYKWEIRDGSNNLKGLYIGKAKGGAKRPTTHYLQNVNRLLKGKPYRAGNPDGYRKTHRALAQAVKNNYKIELSLVCNILDNENINKVEQYYINSFNCCGAENWQLNQ